MEKLNNCIIRLVAGFVVLLLFGACNQNEQAQSELNWSIEVTLTQDQLPKLSEAVEKNESAEDLGHSFFELSKIFIDNDLIDSFQRLAINQKSLAWNETIDVLDYYSKNKSPNLLGIVKALIAHDLKTKPAMTYSQFFRSLGDDSLGLAAIFY